MIRKWHHGPIVLRLDLTWSIKADIIWLILDVETQYFDIKAMFLRHSFPSTLGSCIAELAICSGMGAKNFIFMTSTETSL